MSEQPEQTDQGRREFLGKAAATVAGLAVAPGVLMFDLGNAREPDQAVTSQHRWGMLIDTTKCATGCDACVRACNEEHGLHSHGRPQTDAQWIRKVQLRNKSTGAVHSLPMLCQHCKHPPCVDVCPTGASFKRADGIVLVDKHICIGCRYCMMACPYKARSFIHEELEDQLPHAPRGKGTVESCTLCVHRVDSGRTPACAEACHAEAQGAMLFGDMNDPESELSERLETYASREIRADLGLDTGVRYQGI
jgi:molybdopterin-containing oxidoreductase family iron-sulfur binding subunit